MFMRTSPTSNYHDPPNLIKYACVINNWLIDVKTHALSPSMATTNVGNHYKPSIVAPKFGINAAI